MPLAIAPKGVKLRVVKILAEDKVKKHLESMGLTLNAELTVLSHQSGNSVCVVKDGRLALDGDLSKKILVA